jgi:hypothetical protein
MDESQPLDTRPVTAAPAFQEPQPRRFDPTRELPIPQPRDPSELEDKVERHVRKVEAHVRARPFMTVALALTAGFLIGRVIRD